MWNSRLGDLLRMIVPDPFATTVIVVAVALLIFPIWYLPARTLPARVRRRHAARVPRPVEMHL